MLDLDGCLKLAQIAFFVTAGTVAVLTYIKAKNGLLNTINTEYHKKIIERLSALSAELYEEFDLLSEKHWARDRSAEELVKRINEQVAGNKKRFMEEKDYLAIGIPVVESTIRLQVNSIRLEIEHYFESFNPVRRTKKRDVASEAALLIASRQVRWIGGDPDNQTSDPSRPPSA